MRDIGRNDTCHCGSGKKYKKCCLPKDEENAAGATAGQDAGSSDWGYELFGDRFPQIAEKETRTVTITDSGGSDLPQGMYVFHELFCRERGCDCRRVFFYVTFGLRHEVKAVVCYGWESADFYRNWYKDANPYDIAAMKGPSNEGSPQSEHAPEILELVKNVLIKDRDYMERVKRHYEIGVSP